MTYENDMWNPENEGFVTESEDITSLEYRGYLITSRLGDFHRSTSSELWCSIRITSAAGRSRRIALVRQNDFNHGIEMAKRGIDSNIDAGNDRPPVASDIERMVIEQWVAAHRED